MRPLFFLLKGSKFRRVRVFRVRVSSVRGGLSDAEAVGAFALGCGQKGSEEG